MNKTYPAAEREVPFQTIAQACRTTGLSQYYLRNGCKSGTVPHIKSGRVYLVDVPELMAKLRREQRGGAAT